MEEVLVQVLQEHGVTDRRVLEAFRRTPRELFVPAEHTRAAYLDVPLSIPHGQVTTQPSLIAQMLTALRLTGKERVLEVGTGLGFQTALLGRLAREVWSIECQPDLADQARANLAKTDVHNVTVVVGDGTQGLPDHAPYEGIVVAAAAPHVPEPLTEQLTEGGRLVQPIGPGGMDEVFAFTKHRDHLVQEELVTPAHFVPLLGRYGLPG